MGTEGEGISLDLGIGSSVDPLHLSEVDFYTGQPEKDTPDSDFKNKVLPGSGALHVDRETSYFAADLWMWGVTSSYYDLPAIYFLQVSIYGLSEAYLNDVIITRYTHIIISASSTVSDLTF